MINHKVLRTQYIKLFGFEDQILDVFKMVPPDVKVICPPTFWGRRKN